MKIRLEDLLKTIYSKCKIIIMWANPYIDPYDIEHKVLYYGKRSDYKPDGKEYSVVFISPSFECLTISVEEAK